MISRVIPKLRKWSLLMLLFLAGLQVHAQDLYISEVVPDNDGSLIDFEGDASDWIELYNNSSNSIDLVGWHLTDDAEDLSKWTFPSTNIAPGGLMLVFASDKNRAVSGQELHTNFKLKSSGEYVALVHPDGVVADGYTYPELDEGESFGREFLGATESDLLSKGATCKVHVPTSAADQAGWNEVSFDASSWREGQTGVGYDARSGFESAINMSLLEMRYKNTSAYIRIPFQVSSPETATGLWLDMKYDDGFVAYLNGTRVLSENTDGTEEWNSGAGGARHDLLALENERFDLSSNLPALRFGVNVLAIHALNDSIDLQDLLIVPTLTARFASGISTGAPAILENPTPWQPNAPSEFAGSVEMPTALPVHGIYDTPQQVTLSCNTTGAVIRYTLDDSEPVADSPVYSQPLPVGITTTLRSRAFFDDWKPSLSRTDTYIFLDDVVQQPAETYFINTQNMEYGMDPEVVAGIYTDASNQTFTIQDALLAIPSLCITTDEEHLFDPNTGIYVNPQERWERPASLELIYPDGSEGFQINMGLRIRGGFSRNTSNPKHSFRFFFRDQYGCPKLNYAMFEDEGVDEFDKLDIRTAQNYSWAWHKDPRNTFLRDVFCRDSSAAMGDLYTRSRYYHVYLNGIYWGLYMTEERSEARFAASYLGGDSDDYDTIKRKAGGEGVEATDGDLHAFTRLFEATMNGFMNNADYFAIQGLDADGNSDPALESLSDVGNMINYLLMIYYAAASDNCINWNSRNTTVNNMYAVYNREAPEGFKWIQHDSEHSFDTTADLDRTGPYPHENFLLMNHFNAQTMHEKLCVNPEYRIAFADRVYKHLTYNGALTLQQCEARVDVRMAQIDRAIVAHAARWGSSRHNRDCWLSAAETFREFFVGRCDNVIGYLRDDGLIPSIEPPDASLPGGVVESGTYLSLSTPEGTIYYTLDGSDPRAIGGAPAGQTYSASLAITQPVVIRARARKSDGEWSAQRELVFQTVESPLAITEVMYHAESNQLDFIEIQNVSSQSVSLLGYSLDSSVEFQFGMATLEPGQFAIVADNTNAFLSATSVPANTLLGEYSGNLDNSAEKVSLKFAGESLISFSYSDARNWPQAADGGGHSLVPLASALETEAAGLLDYGGNWRASATFGGSPGAEDVELPVSVVINELIAHTDTGLAAPFDSNDKIELYNASGTSVDVSGWGLSDTLDELARWEIPDGNVIPAGGYLVFDEDDFHPGRTNGFGLDKAGEMVILSAPDRIVDAVRFKGQANGDSYARSPDGAPDWFLLRSTLGGANTQPLPELLLMQVMYHSTNDNLNLEYIQLWCLNHFLASETDAGHWRIDGGVSYEFPEGTILPFGVLWIVPFDPDNDPAALARFCDTYGLNAGQENFFGPYDGKLSNEGERVAIEYPQLSDDPLAPDNISWVVVDEIFYFDQAPWSPEADGTGQALMRTGWTTWGVTTP